MKMLAHADVAHLLSMQSCIDVMEAVFTDLATGNVNQQLRSVVPLARSQLLGLMPAHLKRQDMAGAKIITVFPDNHRRGLPSHQGIVALFDTTTGTPVAVVDAEAVTAIRTAAVSAVATRQLARPDASVLAILGTGQQARSHLEAMQWVRPIQQVNVWGRRRQAAEQFQIEMEQAFGLPIRVFETAAQAVSGADIICTVTASTVPILHGDWVDPGTHVNAVGACRAADRELDTALVERSRFYVDRVESAVHEAGDYLIPLAERAIDDQHIVGELGDLLLGRVEGRTSDRTITIFKSLGLAIEDLAAASFVYQRSVEHR